MTYKTDPSYVDLIRDLPSSVKVYVRIEQSRNYTFPSTFFEDFKNFYFFENDDYVAIILIAIFITALRYIFEYGFCKPIVKCLKLDDKKEAEKFPESAWKCSFYAMMWGYCLYLLIFSGRYDFWTKPWRVFHEWKLEMTVPDDIKFIYFLECGFYLHSVYASLFMDQWRKDAMVILLHHFLTMALIIFSYGTRYHKIGMNVLFVHDICDILLEFTKVSFYLKKRNGRFYPIFEYISNFSFILFTIAWFLFRLYWFPLKILYPAGVVSVYEHCIHNGTALIGFFNVLLWILLCLNIYWFYYILLLLYKIATGQSKELNDTREYEEKTDKKTD